jgi:hypothetical protein
MSFSLRNLVNCFTGRRASRTTARRAGRTNLQLEQFEDRLVPTTLLASPLHSASAFVGPIASSAVAATAAPSLSLQLVPRSGASLTVALDSFDFGQLDPKSSSGKATDDELTVTAPVNSVSSAVFQDLAKGTTFKSAVLVAKDANTTETFTWTLSNVLPVTEKISAGPSIVPVETLVFEFTSMTESYKP